MLRLVRQIELQMAPGLDLVELLLVVHLTLDHRKHAVTNAHNREVLVYHLVVALGPVKNFLHFLREWEVAVRDQCLRVARNVQTIQLLQLNLYLLLVHIKVNWHDSCSGTFQKLNDRPLYKLLSRVWIDYLLWLLSQVPPPLPLSFLDPLEFTLPFSFPGHWLSQDPNNWVLRLLSHMVARSNHGRVVHRIMHALGIVKVFFAV